MAYYSHCCKKEIEEFNTEIDYCPNCKRICFVEETWEASREEKRISPYWIAALVAGLVSWWFFGHR